MSRRIRGRGGRTRMVARPAEPEEILAGLLSAVTVERRIPTRGDVVALAVIRVVVLVGLGAAGWLAGGAEGSGYRDDATAVVLGAVSGPAPEGA